MREFPYKRRYRGISRRVRDGRAPRRWTLGNTKLHTSRWDLNISSVDRKLLETYSQKCLSTWADALRTTRTDFVTNIRSVAWFSVEQLFNRSPGNLPAWRWIFLDKVNGSLICAPCYRRKTHKEMLTGFIEIYIYIYKYFYKFRVENKSSKS